MTPIKICSHQFPLSNKSFEFDIDMYNHQQTKFFVLFNQLLDCKNDDGSGVQITEIIEELDDYCQTYFHLEERLMMKNNYPHLNEHILQHQLFILKVEEFRIAQTYINQAMIINMILIMRKWFFLHIYVVDKKYHDTVNFELLNRKYNLNVDFNSYYNKNFLKPLVFKSTNMNAVLMNVDK